MKFRELLTKTDWNEVKSRLLENYPDVKRNLEGYKSVFDTLLSLPARETKMRICIETVFREGIDDEPHIEVYGKDGTLNKDPPESHYLNETASTKFANSETSFALDLVPWEEWLDMQLDISAIEAFPGPDIVAHCLWEMTFFGFDQGTIEQQREELNRRAKELDNMTENEKKEKLIPWEQVRKKLYRMIEKSEGNPGNK